MGRHKDRGLYWLSTVSSSKVNARIKSYIGNEHVFRQYSKPTIQYTKLKIIISFIPVDPLSKDAHLAPGTMPHGTHWAVAGPLKSTKVSCSLVSLDRSLFERVRGRAEVQTQIT